MAEQGVFDFDAQPEPEQSIAIMVPKREWSSNGPGAFELCTRCVVCLTLRREGKVVRR